MNQCSRVEGNNYRSRIYFHQQIIVRYFGTKGNPNVFPEQINLFLANFNEFHILFGLEAYQGVPLPLHLFTLPLKILFTFWLHPVKIPVCTGIASNSVLINQNQNS
jgi:hypothetical protein